MKKNVLSLKEIKAFQRKIRRYGREKYRSMPWRNTHDPYHIFLSEIMLQQTQVERVKNKYAEFIQRFPTIKELADASLKDVLLVWRGLGYNRRALWLHTSAKIINDKYIGKIPSDVDLLKELPGVGHNTACAIVVYAYNKPVVFIETNIRSVFLHNFFKEKENIHDNDILSYVEATLDTKNPRKWYWALMDYGAELKKKYTNPSRKSRHYIRQSTFEGSNRQLRGKIVRYLLSHEKIFVKDCARSCQADEKKVLRNFHDLMKEGFISKKDEYFVLS